MNVSKCQFCFIIITVVAFSCSSPAKPGKWFAAFNNLGTYSSARMVDLNNDGVLDIVMGAGGKEDIYSDSAVIALNGSNGNLLWAIGGSNQYVGSAVFTDINNDKVPDVFIGGRWAQLTAINGSDGKIIWNFCSNRTSPSAADSGWYNFTTPQLIPDQDGDGIKDLLVANGGNARAEPFEQNRPAGKLLVLNSANGKILADVTVPDGKETYMSVVCPTAKDGNLIVLFGTGGETIGGHLYKTTLKDIMRGDIRSSKILATSSTKGFVASPVSVDLNRDGNNDIVINTADGRMLAINGATDSLLWQLSFPGTEAYTMPAVGLFNADSIPDLFANFAIGTFPTLNYSIRFMVDGKTGKIGYQDTIPAFQYASAIAADLDGDGFDEVIVNQSARKRLQFDYKYYSYLLAFDFKHGKNFALGDSLPATNLASTPWIGDLDGDNHFDIIYSAVKYQGIEFDLQKPLGLIISRFETGIPIKKPASWGGFMGSEYTGIAY